jgi:lysophospholipase L1-like esterase
MRRFSRRAITLPLVLALACVLASTPRELPARNLHLRRAQSSTTPVPRNDHFWVERQAQLNERVKQHPDSQLLFIGDSITHGWEGAGKEVWEKYYAKRHALNLGIGGDQTQHVLWRFDHGNLDGLHPKLAVVMIGTNNAGSGNTSQQVVDGVKAVVDKLRKKLPETKVLVLAIFPRGKNANDRTRKVNEKANELIAKLADGQNVFYLDIGPKFLGSDGTLSPDIMPDYLHPNAKGYEIWASAIEPTVAKLLGESS